jgi:hypothetical protein
VWASRQRPGARPRTVGSLGAWRILAGLAVGFSLMAGGLAALSGYVLNPRDPVQSADVPARPQLLPALETPGSAAFAGGAVPGAGGRVVVRTARRVQVVVPGVIVTALEHTRAGLPRGGMVRVLPTRRVAARRTTVPRAGHPSLQLTTVSRARPRRGPSGRPADVTPPSVTCQTIDPGWHGANVSITCTADDAGSGLADGSSATFTLSTHVAAGDENARAATDARRICDGAGNCAVANAVALSVDRRSPSISCDSPDRSWQAANEAIACTASDGGSGLDDTGDRTFNLRTSVADGDEDASASTGSHRVCDAAGNCATAGPVDGLRIDREAPRLRVSQQPNGSNGWFDTAPAELDAVGTDDQLARVTCVADAGSPFRSTATAPKAATLQLTADGSHDVTCTAVDLAGNDTSDTATVQVDTSAPALTLSTDQSTYGVDDTVTVSCSATDSLSGVDTHDCPPRTRPAANFTLGTHTFTATATDAAGNQASTSASFDVTVSVASLTALTDRLVSDPQAASTLDSDLAAVGNAPDAATKASAIAAYQSDVRALPATAVSAGDADTLASYADGL